MPIILAAILLGLIFNGIILPEIKPYTVGRQLSKIVKDNKIPLDDMFFWNRDSRAAEFFLEKRIKQISGDDILKRYQKNNSWYYMSDDGRESLLKAGLKIEKEYPIKAYNINRIKLTFLNPKTRHKSLTLYYLIKF